ncbi:MAG: hypothetical protein ACM3S5_18865 [Rhodospirillales bacterium]
MPQTTTISNESDTCNTLRGFLANVRETVSLLREQNATLRARNRSLRCIAAFQAFALVLALAGMVALLDWRITATWYGIALCYLPFFARRAR